MDLNIEPVLFDITKEVVDKKVKVLRVRLKSSSSNATVYAQIVGDNNVLYEGSMRGKQWIDALRIRLEKVGDEYTLRELKAIKKMIDKPMLKKVVDWLVSQIGGFILGVVLGRLLPILGL